MRTVGVHVDAAADSVDFDAECHRRVPGIDATLARPAMRRLHDAETGRSLAKAGERLRVEAARVLIEQGRHSMDAIADEIAPEARPCSASTA
jgi:hypothetical protein